MEGYRKSSHAIYRREYYFVWMSKYRYQILVKEVKPRLKDILTELFEQLDITIIEGPICSDHVHMYISMSLKYSPAQVMKLLKGKNAEYLRKEFSELSKRYQEMNIQAREYFVSTVGIGRNVIQAYVKKQIETQIQEEQFRIWRDGSE